MMADHVTNRLLRDKGCARPARGLILLEIEPVGPGSTHVRRSRQQLCDSDGNAVAVHDHGPLGDRQIVRKDAHGVFLGGIQFNDGAAAQPKDLMDRHGCGAKNDGDVDADFIECGNVCFLLRVLRYGR